jgi:crotonobetainyl-CoA:carnitine CoA-transferase CaiB-like acyl-CoA transferase
MTAGLPLEGLVVVELGTSVAAPIGAQIFAELGAEVIKIERPGSGDDARMWGPPFAFGASTVFNAINRNKRSAVVDLKDEGQRAALRRFIVERADVVLQNLRPGLVETFGLDGATLQAERPSLIYCDIAAFGATGPLRARTGYDPLMQAIGGIMSTTGEEGREPVRVGPSIVDQGAGMWAVIGILTALHQRARTGKGCAVQTSLYETALGWITMQISTFLTTGRPPHKIGSENAGIAPYKAFATADGWLVIAAGNDRLFARAADVLGHPEWSADPLFANNARRVENREALNASIAAVVASVPSAVLREKLDTAGVPCAPVLTLDQVVAEPQFAAVGMLQTAPDGELSLLGLPLSFDGKRPPFRSPPPALGADSAVVFATVDED